MDALAGDQAMKAARKRSLRSEAEVPRAPAAELARSNAPGRSPSAIAGSYYAPDPTAQVSTGTGLPHWGWRERQLAWRGLFLCLFARMYRG